MEDLGELIHIHSCFESSNFSGLLEVTVFKVILLPAPSKVRGKKSALGQDKSGRYTVRSIDPMNQVIGSRLQFC